MGAIAERQVRIGVALDVEAIRVGEDPLVAVGGRVDHHHLVALRDPLAGDAGRPSGRTPKLDGGRRVTQHLLDRARQQRQVGHELLPLIVVLGEQRDAGGDESARGLVAGDHQQLEEAIQVAVAEALSVDLGVYDRAPHVVGRMRALLLSPRAGIREHLRERGDERFRVASVFGVVESDEPVRPAVEQVAVIPWDAEDVGQDEQRHLGGDVLQEVDLSLLADGIDNGARMRLDGRLELTAEHLGREGAIDDLAQLGVLRRVHVEHHPAQDRHIRRLRVAQEAGSQPRRELVGVSGDMRDLGMPEHRPEAGPAGERARLGFVDPDDRRLAPHLREQAVRNAVLEGVGVSEVRPAHVAAG